MDGVTILNDNEIVEGIIGGVAWLVCIYQLKEALLSGSNPIVSGILTWTLWFFLRKIGMNLYVDYKQRIGWKGDVLKININPSLIIGIFCFLLILSLIFGFKDHRDIGFKDLELIILIGSIPLIMYLT